MSGEGGSHHPHTPGPRSLMSPDSSRPPIDRGDSVLPNDSASHNGADSPARSAVDIPSVPTEDAPFPFKFKAPSGRVHRLQVVAAAGLTEFVASVTAKLAGEVGAVGGEPILEDGKLGKSGYALSYLDNEGDTVSITTDQDLLDAILLARQGQRDKVDLFVHDPEKPPLAVTDPHPGLAKPLTPPSSMTLRERRRRTSEDDEEEGEEPARRERKPTTSEASQVEQFIAGVPNDLLLPGAIVTLAVVIVGVFALSRSGSR